MGGLGHLNGHLRGQAILVGDAAGLQEAFGAILFDPGVRAVRLGNVERGLRAVASQPEVAVVEHRDHRALRDAIAFIVQHAHQPGRNFRNHRHLRAGFERAGQRQRFREIARFDRRCAHRDLLLGSD